MQVLPEVLFISHSTQRCGVNQFGLNVSAVLSGSQRYAFRLVECNSAADYLRAMTTSSPAAVIYNHHPATMPWLNRLVTLPFRVPHIGIIHEVTQRSADAATALRFDFHIAPDPTLVLRNPRVFKTGRLVPRYENRFPIPEIPTIGSFGFGIKGKGFEALIDRVQAEFDEAVIRLHVPYAAFADDAGEEARRIAAACRGRLHKSRIRLDITHDFLSQQSLLDFLALNSLNAFFYEPYRGRGIASVLDFALAVGRPMAITGSTMFRHLADESLQIDIANTTLREILARGAGGLELYRDEWCPENLLWDYERIVSSVLAAPRFSLRRTAGATARRFLGRALSSRQRRDWSPSSLPMDFVSGTSRMRDRYESLDLPSPHFNRILDDNARKLYSPTIRYLERTLPGMIRRKIPEANIQQAFVLDTVTRFAARQAAPRLLCIGSYDDTAAAALKQSGLRVDEVDPVLNCDLSTFLTKPTTKKASYDVVFSTSVIEHVSDDEAFVRDIGTLLKAGGVGVLTCDYNDQYSPGDKIPFEDFRFYTQKVLKERLLAQIPDCELVDTPQWDCAHPDFHYGGCRYTFATVVFRRKSS